MSFNMLHTMLRTVQHVQPCPGLDRQAIKPAVTPYNDCGLHYVYQPLSDRQESSNKARSTMGCLLPARYRQRPPCRVAGPSSPPSRRRYRRAGPSSLASAFADCTPSRWPIPPPTLTRWPVVAGIRSRHWQVYGVVATKADLLARGSPTSFLALVVLPWSTVYALADLLARRRHRRRPAGPSTGPSSLASTPAHVLTQLLAHRRC
jgi:hypothetical protein